MKKTKILSIVTVVIVFLFINTSVNTTFVIPSAAAETNSSNTGEKRAIIIGITEYKNFHTLPAKNPAATKLYNELLNKGWKTENIKLLTDKNATKQNIIDELDWLQNVSTDNDIVLFSFAGHGSIINGSGDRLVDYVICLHDSNSTNKSSFISDKLLNSKLSNINAHGFYIIIDS